MMLYLIKVVQNNLYYKQLNNWLCLFTNQLLEQASQAFWSAKKVLKKVAQKTQEIALDLSFMLVKIYVFFKNGFYYYGTKTKLACTSRIKLLVEIVQLLNLSVIFYDPRVPSVTLFKLFLVELNTIAVIFFVYANELHSFTIKLQGVLTNFLVLNGTVQVILVFFFMPVLLFLQSRVLTFLYFFCNGSILVHYYKILSNFGWVDEVLQTRWIQVTRNYTADQKLEFSAMKNKELSIEFQIDPLKQEQLVDFLKAPRLDSLEANLRQAFGNEKKRLDELASKKPQEPSSINSSDETLSTFEKLSHAWSELPWWAQTCAKLALAAVIALMCYKGYEWYFGSGGDSSASGNEAVGSAVSSKAAKIPLKPKAQTMSDAAVGETIRNTDFLLARRLLSNKNLEITFPYLEHVCRSSNVSMSLFIKFLDKNDKALERLVYSIGKNYAREEWEGLFSASLLEFMGAYLENFPRSATK